MKLIAQKPCSFGGKKFFIGDEIPTEFVMDPAGQVKMGVLAFAGEGPIASAEAPAAAMPIVVRVKEGDMSLNITGAGLQAMVNVMTGNPKDVEAIVKEITDGDALILLHMLDTRKAVKAAAEAQAKAVNQAGEQ